MKIQFNILETRLEDVSDDSKHTACDLWAKALKTNDHYLYLCLRDMKWQD